MQCIVIHEVCDGFHFIFKKTPEIKPKNNFLAHFWRFLVYIFLRPVSYTPIFCQIKRLMEVHNCSKFHQCSICGCQVINFETFSWRYRRLETNMTRYCWNFNQRYVVHKKKAVSEQTFKIKCLSGNRTHPKLMVLVRFWAQFNPMKTQNITKNQNFFQKLNPYDHQKTQFPGPR